MAKRREITRKDVSLNSTSRAPIPNINSTPPANMKPFNLPAQAGLAEKKGGASWKGKSNWT